MFRHQRYQQSTNITQTFHATTSRIYDDEHTRTPLSYFIMGEIGDECQRVGDRVQQHNCADSHVSTSAPPRVEMHANDQQPNCFMKRFFLDLNIR